MLNSNTSIYVPGLVELRATHGQVLDFYSYPTYIEHVILMVQMRVACDYRCMVYPAMIEPTRSSQ